MSADAALLLKVSRRVTEVPPYLFAAIDKARDEAKARGLDVISLGIGDPDQPTLKPIVKEMHNAIDRPANHRYPAYEGSREYRTAVARWMQRRFGVTLDPMSEIMALIGAKEGIMHFSMAVLDPGDICIVPEPSYPTYRTSAQCAGATVFDVPLLEANNFQIDLGAIPEDIARKASLIWVNYPNNPTTAVASRDFFRDVIAWARKYEVIVVNDNAYSEIYFEEADRPISIFEFDGARDVAVELYSLSKGYNMTGWRIGWACGRAEYMQALSVIKNNTDSGVFNAIQEASIVGLDLPFEAQDPIRNLYKARRDRVVSRLTAAGFSIYPCRGTIYLWGRVPTTESSVDYASRLLQETGVVIGPGRGWGPSGEGYFRLCLTTADDRLDEAIGRIIDDLAKWKSTH